MKKARLASVLSATVFSLAIQPTHAIMIDDRTVPAYFSVLDIAAAQPGNNRVTWYSPGTLMEGVTLGMATGWRQLSLSQFSPGLKTTFPQDKTSPFENGEVSSVPEPPMLLLLASGLVGLIWSARMKSAKNI